MNMIKPYVGISCVTSRDEANAVAKQFLSSGFSRSNELYQGAIGYAMTWEMLRQKIPLGTRYVGVKGLPDIMMKNQNFGINVLHFVPEPGSYQDLLSDVTMLFLDSGLYTSEQCRVMQLNYGTCIAVEALELIKNLLPELKIIFQVGRTDLENKDLDVTVKTLKKYSEYIDMFLIDPSQGTGREIDIKIIQKLIPLLQQECPFVGIGFAGGFSAENIQNRIQVFASLSSSLFAIDVESGVRSKVDDLLDFEKTQNFIQNSAKCFLYKTC